MIFFPFILDYFICYLKEDLFIFMLEAAKQLLEQNADIRAKYGAVRTQLHIP